MPTSSTSKPNLADPASALLLAYYGDDFTGSTDVMEALQWAGLRTVLFLAPPSKEQLAKFDRLRAFGVAGWSRTMSPSEMESELKPALAGLRDSHVPLVHYKICSTFDSSPEIGSIGKALEAGRELFGGGCVPILVGAPILGRYQVFGNLFARSGLDTEPFRLDSHPTMSRHPITPMDEADLRLHLSRQTRLPIRLVDVLQLDQAAGCLTVPATCELSETPLLFDVLREEHLPVIGRAICAFGQDRQLFVVGSSGIEYALVAHWNLSGAMNSLRSHPPGQPGFGPVQQLVVLTGSCSPVNDRQIAWALQNGFVDLPLNPARIIDPKTSHREIESSTQRATQLLDRGLNVILHSCRGPEDPRVVETNRQYAGLGFTELDVKLKNGRTLGPKLGRILAGILQHSRLARAGVAGGDTSGYVARELGIDALEACAPVAPGSPLCRVHSAGALDGLEIIFKGGQVGNTDIWGTLLKGTIGNKP